MRCIRTTAVVAVALTSALSLAGCAKDSGGSSGGSASGGKAAPCKLADKPPVPAGSTTTTGAEGTVDASKLKIGLAFDVGGRGDASFNDAAAAGVDKSKSTMGVKDVKETTASVNESPDAKEGRLRQLAQDGYNPIVAVGFAYADAVKSVATQFPGTKFAIVDDDTITLPNVTPLVFAEEQGSFLVGVAAAYKSKDCHVGFVGGVDTPLIQKFQAGFVQGAKAAAPDIKIEQNYISPAGDFTGFQAPDKGNVVAKGEIDAGADVIYHAAGASGKGVFDAAKAASVEAIGVDSDQYNQATVAQDKDVIITSMVKKVDLAVSSYIAAVAKGDLSTVPKRFDLKTGGIAYATSGGKVDDIKDVLDGYRAEIVDGKITVSATPTK